jgi:gas vesicle protein
MNDEGRNDTLLNLLAGVGIGALVGAAAALLLAPQTGQETRSQIRETADDLLVRLRDTVEDMRTKVDEMVASVKARGGGAGTTAATAPGEGAEEATAPGI